METKRKRIWEIDFLRGIALVLMIVFHVVFDLNDIYDYPIYYGSGFFYYIGKTSAILFMLLSGVSCFLSRDNIKRGLKIFGIAMILTLITYLYNPAFEIKFGILHFLGICMMIYPLLKKMNRFFIILLSIVIIIVGNMFSKITVSSQFLFPIGLMSSTFTSSDYYPLLPWMGVFLIGAVVGMTLYGKKESLFKYHMRDNIIMKLGRNTLLVYIIHQPLILLVLELISKHHVS